MQARLARWAPLGASLLGHGAVLGALAAGLLFAGGDGPEALPVGRAPDAPGPALRLLGATEAPGPAAAAQAVPLDSPDPRYRPYLAGVRRRIWERWGAPALPPGRPARGSLVVEFTLTRGGFLGAAAVREPSGVAELDRAALAAVEGAGPFGPLPEAIGDPLTVRARFVYD